MGSLYVREIGLSFETFNQPGQLQPKKKKKKRNIEQTNPTLSNRRSRRYKKRKYRRIGWETRRVSAGWVVSNRNFGHSRAGCRRMPQHQVTTSDLALSNDDECDNQVQKIVRERQRRTTLRSCPVWTFPPLTVLSERDKRVVRRFLLQDYEDELENGRGRRHSSPGGSRGNPRDYGHHHLHPDNLVSG